MSKFQIKKEIDLTSILAMLSLVGGIFIYCSAFDSRLAKAETEIKNSKQDVIRLEDYLIRIENKVDKIRK
jgi:hypothetical protein